VSGNIKILAQQIAGEGLGKAVPFFERQYLTGSFYLYHSFSVIVAQPLTPGKSIGNHSVFPS